MSRKGIVLLVGGLLVGWVMVDALGVFDQSDYTAIPHGSHDHYVPKVRDEGVGVDKCPTRMPEADEFISSQCQLIRVVENQGIDYYVPDNVQTGIPFNQLPSRSPGPGEIITPAGQIQKAEIL